MKERVMRKRFILLFLAIMMIFTSFITVFADENNNDNNTAQITFSLERKVLGQPDIIPPKKVNIIPGEKASIVLDRILKEAGIQYKNTGTLKDAFYLATISLDGKEWLGEFDHGRLSGWMYSINGWRPNVGMSCWNLKDGDVFRLYYTTREFGKDIDTVDKIYALRDKVSEAKGYKKSDYSQETIQSLEKVILEVEKNIPTDEQIGKMMSVTLGSGDVNLDELSAEMDKYIKEIDKAIEDLGEKPKPMPEPKPEPPKEPEKPDITPQISAGNMEVVNNSIDKAGKWILEDAPVTGFGNEWYIISLSRSGYPVPKSYYENYYKSVEEKIKSKKCHFRKATDLERVILALTAIKKDPTNIAGYNLIDTLWNYKNITKQGLNGPVFALIALDTNNYKEPDGVVNTRENLIKEILTYKTKDGGFSLNEGANEADVDMTAMTLQALSNYSDKPEVKDAIDSSLEILSKIQLDNGGYYSPWSGENVQSAAQVIVALTALGKDINDPANGFVKKNGDLLSYVLTYQNTNGAFEHPKNVPNGMATEQSMYTLAAYKRFVDGQTKLYDMSYDKKDEEYFNGLVFNKEINNLQTSLKNKDNDSSTKIAIVNKNTNDGNKVRKSSNIVASNKEKNKKDSKKKNNDKNKKDSKKNKKTLAKKTGYTDKEIIQALEKNNEELRGTIKTVQQLYSSNMTKYTIGFVVLLVVTNLATLIITKRFKRKKVSH